MKKFKFLTFENIKKVIWNKAFLISNIILFIVIVLMLNLPAIINSFSDEADVISVQVHYDNLENTNHEKMSGYIENKLSDEQLKSMGVQGFIFEFSIGESQASEENILELSKNYEEGSNEILIWFSNISNLEELKVDIYHNSVSQTALNTLSSTIMQSRVVIEDISLPIVEVNYHTKIVDDSMSEDKILRMTMINLIISIPMLIIVLRAVMFVGVDIVQEKSTKAIETIISSVPPKTHFLSKVSASVVFMLAQGGLMLLFVLIGTFIGGTLKAPMNGNIPGFSEGMDLQFGGHLLLYLFVAMMFALVFALIFIVLGGLVAAMSNTQEDYQNAQGPLTLILLIGFYLNMFLIPAGNTGFAIIKVLSYIPPLSGFVAPVAFAGGVITWWQMLISLIIMGLFLVLILFFFGPLYRVSILSYDNSKFVKRMSSYFKKARLERKKNRNDKPRID